jgi:hypothetical protein
MRVTVQRTFENMHHWHFRRAASAVGVYIFSKDLYNVTSHSKYTRARTFHNFNRACLGSEFLIFILFIYLSFTFLKKIPSGRSRDGVFDQLYNAVPQA